VCGPQTSAAKALLSAVARLEPGSQQAVDR
jgi:hypothetical protein